MKLDPNASSADAFKYMQSRGLINDDRLDQFRAMTPKDRDEFLYTIVVMLTLKLAELETKVAGLEAEGRIKQ